MYRPAAYDNYLCLSDNYKDIILIGSPQWYDWLNNPDNKNFSYEHSQYQGDNFSVSRKGKLGTSHYSSWNAIKTINGKSKCFYLGKGKDLTLDKLIEICKKFEALKNYPIGTDEKSHSEESVDKPKKSMIQQMMDDVKKTKLRR